MKQLVGLIAQSLVDSPDAVDVAEIQGEPSRVVELRVAKDDVGKIIGKHGRIAQAIRTLISAASAPDRKFPDRGPCPKKTNRFAPAARHP